MLFLLLLVSIEWHLNNSDVRTIIIIQPVLKVYNIHMYIFMYVSMYLPCVYACTHIFVCMCGLGFSRLWIIIGNLTNAVKWAVGVPDMSLISCISIKNCFTSFSVLVFFCRLCIKLCFCLDDILVLCHWSAQIVVMKQSCQKCVLMSELTSSLLFPPKKEKLCYLQLSRSQCSCSHVW